MTRASLSRPALRLLVASAASAAVACSALSSVDELSENYGKPAGAAGQEGGSGGSLQAGAAGSAGGEGGSGRGGAGLAGAGAGGAGQAGAGQAGAGGAGQAGAGAGGAGGAAPKCPEGMTQGGRQENPFCIDNFEVTQAQYKNFLENIAQAPPPPITQACQENTDWKPHKGPPNSGCTEAAFTPDATPNRPVVCVDWCDAQSYCASKEKFLCRALDGSSKYLDNKSPTEKQQDMWWLACTSNGDNLYPYGKALVPKACNAQQPGVAGELEDVGASPGCKVPNTQLFDMNGNAREWVNACIEQDGLARCATVGGGYNNQPGAGCDHRFPFDPKQAAPDIGFRCCKD